MRTSATYKLCYGDYPRFLVGVLTVLYRCH